MWVEICQNHNKGNWNLNENIISVAVYIKKHTKNKQVPRLSGAVCRILNYMYHARGSGFVPYKKNKHFFYCWFYYIFTFFSFLSLYLYIYNKYIIFTASEFYQQSNVVFLFVNRKPFITLTIRSNNVSAKSIMALLWHKKLGKFSTQSLFNTQRVAPYTNQHIYLFLTTQKHNT